MPLDIANLDLSKYLGEFASMVGEAIGPPEAEAFPRFPKLPKATPPKTGMSVGAKAMAEKGKNAKVVGHHTIPLGEGPPALQARQLDWHLRNLFTENPSTYIKDIPTKMHKELHVNRQKKYAQMKKESMLGAIPPPERIQSLTPIEQASLWKLLQGEVEQMRQANPTISEQLRRMGQ